MDPILKRYVWYRSFGSNAIGSCCICCRIIPVEEAIYKRVSISLPIIAHNIDVVCKHCDKSFKDISQSNKDKYKHYISLYNVTDELSAFFNVSNREEITRDMIYKLNIKQAITVSNMLGIKTAHNISINVYKRLILAAIS